MSLLRTAAPRAVAARAAVAQPLPPKAHSWKAARALPARDVLSIHGLETQCVVGVYPRERGQPQPLRVDIDLTVDSEAAALTGKLSRTVDYDATACAVVFLLESCRFGLLETAAHALARFLLAEPLGSQRQARVQAVRIRLVKPQALPGAAVAALCIERDASWAVLERQPRAFGSVDVILRGREASIVRMNLAPAAEVDGRQHEAHDAELALTDGLLLDGAPFPRGTRRWAGRGAQRVLANPTRRWQSVLCVDSPARTRARVRPVLAAGDSLERD